MHKGDTYHRVLRHDIRSPSEDDLLDGHSTSSSEERDLETDGLLATGTSTSTLVDVLEDSLGEKTKTTRSWINIITESVFPDLVHWVAVSVTPFTTVMTRPRTSSSVRLPLYDSRPPLRGPHPHPHPHTISTALSLRNGSPPKVRRKRSLFLYQMKYSRFWRPRSLQNWMKLGLLVLLGVLGFVLMLWEPHVEITFYPRSWIAREVLAVEPLAGCFDSSRVSPRYNLSNIRAPKRTEVHSGMPMRFGMDCYDFASTIPPPSRDPHSYSHSEHHRERINYHTYWRADLVPFGERQEWMVKSFFATQDLSHARLILWSNGDLRSNEMVRRWTRKYPESFQLRIVDVDELALGTALVGSDLLYAKDSKAWVDGDLVRLLVTWAYGGVWVDMDSLLTRDLSPLLEHEFVTQWDCYDKAYQPMNGAVMHFFQHSPYLCEAFEIMARSPPPKSGTTEWGSLLYLKLWRRLISASIPPFKILPFCFTDGRSCRLDNRLPDPFLKDRDSRSRYWSERGMHEGGPLDQVLGRIFSVHLHNQWRKAFPRGGWVERLLLRRYDRALGIEASPLHRGDAEKPFLVSKDID